jgi:light-regulated signal transduction histidine kinase (bacteriophytochrome)/ActR/RegA family two-component response regulator
VAHGSTDARAYQAVDLTSCDREPIHIIGAIQQVGFLIALSPDWRIVRASSNAADHLGRPVHALLGAPAAEVFSAEAVHRIRNHLSTLRTADSVERVFAMRLQPGGPLFDLAIHMSGQTIVVEAEPSQSAGDLNAGAMVRSMLNRLQDQPSVVREAARLVQALTGFDRVMIYRFHPDDSGEVIAESVRSGLQPYLGLRYPAADIPRQARALLVRNPVRLLADVGAETCPIETAAGVGSEPLDLSMSTLRAHSAMHVQYLTNMGVGATMTVSLLRDQRLWGLISCHHMSPRHVGYEKRTTVDLFAQMLSFLIERQERDELAAYQARTKVTQHQLTTALVRSGGAGEPSLEIAGQMSELVACDGVAVCIGGTVSLDGQAPTLAEFEPLRRVLAARSAGKVFAIEALRETYPPAADFASRTAGLLVVPASHAPDDYLVFFRTEAARSVLWAGEPGKVGAAASETLTPRKSFEAWRQTVEGHSTPWSDAELSAAEALRVTLLEAGLNLNGMTEKKRRAATDRHELLVAELNHRVRNILGLIRGLVSQSRIHAVDLDTFATVLGDRVHALARAHDQITAKNWGPGSLATLIATETAAYSVADAGRIVAGGPSVLLAPHAFSAVVLVVHELLTNAAKHGALSTPGGRIAIQWRRDEAGDVVLDWTETGGPAVEAPSRRGFGSTIIERSIPYELGGTARLDFAHSGLQARFTVPSAYATAGSGGEVTRHPTLAAPSARLSGLVLLVEDNMLLALETETLLLTLGAAQVAVASNAADALRHIDRQIPDFALLDVNLGREMSWTVADRLRGLGVPHIFATGYGDGIQYPTAHRNTPVVTKPYTAATIARAVAEARPQQRAAAPA